ncbi:MAG: hypothetical protein HFJ52_07485 [Clostridia bacterium]|nr:hypothetical protein [Clostridia bacterium]
MKVLFAVNNEDISESIIKLYQKEYREIISGKNVYYFNAIIKELQRDQTYDRIVISEDLEPYNNNNFDLIDKFLFEQLDKISDEAISESGTDIPIIFIATDRRSKSDNLLSKLFSIGVYDALLGGDRSIPEVCKLLNKPRTKKEAKTYYKIETEEVSYQTESEDSVSETEIQNIITHYKKLGKNTDRYVDSFNNIAAQYTDAQLRVISKFLPMGVRAVLEVESPKYQSIMTFGEGTYKRIEKAKEQKKKEGLKIGFIETSSEKAKPNKAVVIPSAVKTDGAKKLTKKEEPKEIQETETPDISSFTSLDDMFEEEPQKEEKLNNEKKQEENQIEEKTSVEEPVKRKRGRPKKIIEPGTEEVKVPKKRGRPRKVVEPDNKPLEGQENILPGFEEEKNTILPGFEEKANYVIPEGKSIPKIEENIYERQIENVAPRRESIDLTRLLTKDKKIVAFVGTAKAGTSFLINNIADMLSKTGIKTAVVDLTENRNSYYIYTKNEEPLRRIASNCLEKIESGIVEGIDVSKNLTVFTSIPNQKIEVSDIDVLVANLIKKFSLVLLDCDFKTDETYFELAQEIYLVQSMDILTIQPLTAFLRDLQSSGKLVPSKLKAVINKAIKVRGLSTKAIIGGMSCYNNPEMSYMRELFDKEKIQTLVIPFDEDTLSKYLSGMVDCFVSTSGYSKQFLSELKKLGDNVYPLVTNKFKPEFTKKDKNKDEF